MPAKKPHRSDHHTGKGIEVTIFAEIDDTLFALCSGHVASEHWTEESDDGVAYVDSVTYDDIAEAITELTKRDVLNQVRRQIGTRTIRQLEKAAEEAAEELEQARIEVPI
jgi:hypothetical protein